MLFLWENGQVAPVVQTLELPLTNCVTRSKFWTLWASTVAPEIRAQDAYSPRHTPSGQPNAGHTCMPCRCWAPHAPPLDSGAAAHK